MHHLDNLSSHDVNADPSHINYTARISLHVQEDDGPLQYISNCPTDLPVEKVLEQNREVVLPHRRLLVHCLAVAHLHPVCERETGALCCTVAQFSVSQR